MKINELSDLLKMLLKDRENRPVVVFSSLWPFYRALEDVPRQEIVDSILDVLLSVIGPHRDLLMPAFSKGFQDSFIDLDSGASLSGVMTEKFRQKPRTRRSVCPWFSFSCQGPSAEHIVSLRPLHAWGDGSLYEWMENRDVILLMLGTDACSYFHRVEWLNKHIISYRFEKEFCGTVLHEGNRFDLVRILFVRYLEPEVLHNFTVMNEDLVAGGMKKTSFGGVPISVVTSSQMHKVFHHQLQIDPLISVANREEIEQGAIWYNG